MNSVTHRIEQFKMTHLLEMRIETTDFINEQPSVAYRKIYEQSQQGDAFTFFINDKPVAACGCYIFDSDKLFFWMLVDRVIRVHKLNKAAFLGMVYQIKTEITGCRDEYRGLKAVCYIVDKDELYHRFVKKLGFTEDCTDENGTYYVGTI